MDNIDKKKLNKALQAFRNCEYQDFLNMVRKDKSLLNVRVNTYESALQFLVTEDEIELVKELVKLGADVNELNLFDDTALLLSTILNYLEMSEFLISKGADINYCNEKSGRNAMINAIEQKTTEMIDLLLKYNVDVNSCCGGSPILFYFESYDIFKNIKMVDYFIKKGKPNLNLYDDYGNSIVHSAIMSGNKMMVDLLIENGADLYFKNMEGLTSFELMEEYDYPQ